jgi:hypothetical protein
MFLHMFYIINNLLFNIHGMNLNVDSIIIIIIIIIITIKF